MENCGMSFIKYVLFIFNFLFAVSFNKYNYYLHTIYPSMNNCKSCNHKKTIVHATIDCTFP